MSKYFSERQQLAGLAPNVKFYGEHKLHENQQGHYCYYGHDSRWYTFTDDAHFVNTVHDNGYTVEFFTRVNR